MKEYNKATLWWLVIGGFAILFLAGLIFGDAMDAFVASMGGESSRDGLTFIMGATGYLMGLSGAFMAYKGIAGLCKSNKGVPLKSYHLVRVILAVVACILILTLNRVIGVILSAFLGLKHATGLIGYILLFPVLGWVWRAIVGDSNAPVQKPGRGSAEAHVVAYMKKSRGATPSESLCNRSQEGKLLGGLQKAHNDSCCDRQEDSNVGCLVAGAIVFLIMALVICMSVMSEERNASVKQTTSEAASEDKYQEIAPAQSRVDQELEHVKVQAQDEDEQGLMSALHEVVKEQDRRAVPSDPYEDLRTKLIYVRENGDDKSRVRAANALSHIDAGTLDGFDEQKLGEVRATTDDMYNATRELRDDFTPEERMKRAEDRAKIADVVRAKMQFVVDHNGDCLLSETRKAKNALDYLNTYSLDKWKDKDINEMVATADELYRSCKIGSRAWLLLSDGPKGEWCPPARLSVEDVLAHNSKKGLPALNSFLGVEFGEYYRKFSIDDEKWDLLDGIFTVKARTNKILSFDKYSMAVLCDGRIVGVEAQATVSTEQVDGFVNKLLGILETKYGRLSLQQSCDRDIWKIFFPERRQNHKMDGSFLERVPMLSEIGVIVKRLRLNASVSVVHLVARDIRLWNEHSRVYKTKIVEEEERSRRNALDSL